jgi:hypothetical protein
MDKQHKFVVLVPSRPAQFSIWSRNIFRLRTFAHAGFDSLGLERWWNIDHRDVRRMVLENPFEVSATLCGGPGLNHVANYRLVL